MWRNYWQTDMENVLEKVKYSFVLPAYKAKYLKESIDSIINQTYTDFELIIVNDASPEDVDSIVNSYQDDRIQYYRNEKNIGGVNLDHFLLRMLSAPLWRYARNRAFKYLQERLLYAFAGYVARDGYVFTLATNFVYFINVDYALLRHR